MLRYVIRSLGTTHPGRQIAWINTRTIGTKKRSSSGFWKIALTARFRRYHLVHASGRRQRPGKETETVPCPI
jgi:hypothetical protein